MFDRVIELLEDSGVESLKLALGVFMLLSLCWAVVLSICCYFFSPTEFIARNIPVAWVQKRLKSKESIEGAEESYVSKMQQQLRGRTVRAICEMLLLKTLLAPILLPINISLTILIIC